MIASWMIYIVLVSVAVALAGSIVERALRAIRLPARLLWIGAICFPVVVITSGWLVEAVQARQSVAVAGETARGLTLADQASSLHFTMAVSPSSRLAKLDSTLLALWIASSLVTLGLFAGAAARLRRIRSAAEARDIDGVRVCVTPSTGPLVVGVVNPQILIPRWVLKLEPSEQQLVVAHEWEHLRSRDPALLAFSAFAVALAPWNPLMWYMLRRLGQAVELDCDKRVLAERPDMHAYARLLLSVASRNQTSLLPLAGLAASTSSLEQRVRSMAMNSTGNRGYRVISAIAVVALLVVATAMIPRPKRDVERGAQLSGGTSTIQNAARATGRVKVVSTSGSATYKVYATGGSFAEAGKSLVARTDTLTKAVASGLNSAGDVFDIDVTNGDVHFVSQGTSSLHVEAAMSGVSRAQWLSMTGRHVVIESGGAGVRGGDLRRDLGQAKTPFFEFQVDTPAIARETVNPRYPEALKKSGISGEVWAQFVVDTTGRVDMGTFKALKSPDPEFTAAIKAVLPAWRFDPAMTRGKKIKQLVQQAFVFGRPPQL